MAPLASQHGFGEFRQETTVVEVGQQLARFAPRAPAELVDLPVGREGVVLRRLHDPIPDDLRPPLRVVVPGLARRLAERAAEAGLLFDLAEGGILVAFAGLVLPLGSVQSS